jgi:N-methylhydantoinase B
MQLNAAGIVVAKMLGCAGEDVRELALGPCIPHFYGHILGGADARGNIFILANTDGMIGSLGGMPERDGVDAGGHFWIPDGIAANCEDLEAQYPLLVLSRRLLPIGADGAGRHRGGLGFSETAMTRGALAAQHVLHTNEAFSKAQGVFGGSPGTRASMRLRRSTDVAGQLAAGSVPLGVGDLTGEEELIPFKGAPLALGPEDVWEWVSPSTAGWGDPLRREPADVLADITGGRLEPATAARVYGVIVAGAGIDEAATIERRRELRRERLGTTATPADPIEPPASARLVGDLLCVVEGRWWCNGADLGGVDENYRERCKVREVSARQIAPEFEASDTEIADQMVFREYLCPVTGYRIDAEIARAGEPVLQDIRLVA